MMWLGAKSRLAWAVAFAAVALCLATASVALGSPLPRFAGDVGIGQDQASTSGNQFPFNSDNNQVAFTSGDTAAEAFSVPSADGQGDTTSIDAGTGDEVVVNSGQDQVSVSGDQVSISSGQGQVSVSGNQVSIDSSSQVTISSFPTMPPFPTFPPLPTPVPAPTAAPNSAPSASQGTFTLCGGPDPQAEQAIASLIDGHNFSSRLVSRPDGCVDLSISVSPRMAGVTGRQSVNMTVPVGPRSGGSASSVSIQIVTENGVTRVSIGAGK